MQAAPISPSVADSGSPEGAPAAAGRPAWNWLRIRWGFAFLLILGLGAAIYHPVSRFEFLCLDDPAYIRDNPWMARGLCWDSVQWAFRAHLTEFSRYAEYWSPLTLLTRLADAQLYGIHAGPFHVTSVLIHLLNAALLGTALWALTKRWERSAIVALLFLVHPQNVEAVCWLSARKDLVSATLFFVTLLAYARYAESPTRGRYAGLLLAYLGALMAKPMGVSIPLVLLLLDYWPLGRWSSAGGGRSERVRLVAEKIPLFMMAVAAAGLAVLGQQGWGAIDTRIPFLARGQNAVVAYAAYARRVFWPNDLTVYYPHPMGSLPISLVAGSAACLAVITVAAILSRRRYPQILTGWLWFGVVLGPVIGLVQIGEQAMADRYAYPSAIGIFVAVVWTAADLFPRRGRALLLAAAAAIAALAVCAAHQVWFWRNSEVAFLRAAAVTRDNYHAEITLFGIYFDRGDMMRAREHCEAAVRIRPGNFFNWSSLACIQSLLGDDLAAAHSYERSLALNPDNAQVLLFLGSLVKKHERYASAELLFQRSSRLEPKQPAPYRELADLYARQSRWQEAARMWTAYLQLAPQDQNARQRLAEAEAALAAAAPSPP